MRGWRQPRPWRRTKRPAQDGVLRHAPEDGSLSSGAGAFPLPKQKSYHQVVGQTGGARKEHPRLSPLQGGRRDLRSRCPVTRLVYACAIRDRRSCGGRCARRHHMRMAIFGAGAVGAYVGGRLAQAGVPVAFLTAHTCEAASPPRGITGQTVLWPMLCACAPLAHSTPFVVWSPGHTSVLPGRPPRQMAVPGAQPPLITRERHNALCSRHAASRGSPPGPHTCDAAAGRSARHRPVHRRGPRRVST